MKKIISVIIIIIVVIIAAFFLFTPTSKEISSTARFYDCSMYKLPLSEETFDNFDFMDINYELEIKQNAFFITDINGYITIQDNEYIVGDYSNYDSHNDLYICSLKYENGHTDYAGLTFSEDLSSARILYNDGKYDENKKGAWFGPCNSYNELIEVLKKFELAY